MLKKAIVAVYFVLFKAATNSASLFITKKVGDGGRVVVGELLKSFIYKKNAQKMISNKVS